MKPVKVVNLHGPPPPRFSSIIIKTIMKIEKNHLDSKRLPEINIIEIIVKYVRRGY